MGVTLSPALAALMAPVHGRRAGTNGRMPRARVDTARKGPPFVEIECRALARATMSSARSTGTGVQRTGTACQARNPVRGGRDTPRLGRPFSAGAQLGAAPPSDLASSVRNAMRTKGSVFLAIVAGVAFAQAAAAADL